MDKIYNGIKDKGWLFLGIIVIFSGLYLLIFIPPTNIWGWIFNILYFNGLGSTFLYLSIGTKPKKIRLKELEE